MTRSRAAAPFLPGRSPRSDLVAACTYAAVGVLTARAAADVGGAALLWPAAGIGLAYLLRVGRRGTPAIAAGAALMVLLLDQSPGTLLLTTAAISLEVWVAATVFVAIAGPEGRLHGRRAVAALVAASAAGPAVAALLVVLALAGPDGVVGRSLQHADALTVAYHAWATSCLGMLLVTPGLLAWGTPDEGRSPARGSRGRAREVALLVAVAVASAALVRVMPGGGPAARALGILAFPLVCWGALSFGTRGASAIMMLMAGLAVAGFTQQAPPIGPDGFDQVHLLRQYFLGSLALTGLMLAVELEVRRRAERDLEASESRLRTLIDHAPEAIFVVAVDPYRMVSVNPRAEQLFGRSREALLADSPSVLSAPIQPDGQPSHVKMEGMLARILAGEEVVDEWLYRRADGSDVPCEVRGVRHPDPYRPLARLSVTDISARKAAEAAVAESRSLAQRVTAAVPGIVYRWEQAPGGPGRFTFASGDPTRFGALSAEVVLGDDRDVLATLHPEDVTRVRASMTAATAVLAPWRDEFRVRDRNGRDVWLRASALPEPLRRDGTRVYNGILVDITSERLAEEVDHAKRAVLEAIAAGAPGTEVLARIVHLSERQVAGSVGSILLVDETGARLRHGAAPGMPPGFITAVDGLPIAPGSGACGTAAYTDTTFVSADVATDPRLQPWRELADRYGVRAIWSVPFHGEAGQVVGTLALYLGAPRGPEAVELEALETMASLAGIAVQRDLADRRYRETERQLHQAQKMEAVGQLAGGIAHDFNNILTVILSTSQLMLEDVEAGSALALDAQLIRDSAERAGALTRQLLAFSRRQLWQPDAVDVNAALRRVFPMLERLAGAPIAVTLELAEGLGPVWIDAGQFEQVLVNLVVNARDAMPDGGTLRIATDEVELGAADVRGEGVARAGRHVRLVIQDSGVGMDEATRLRVFEPFFTTKGPGRGTGLGLATVYGIVRRAEGAVTIESAPGVGTALTLLLPVRTEAAVAPGAAPPPAAPSLEARPGEAVLLVEDEPEVRRVARRLLADRGYAVVEAEGPERARALALAHGGAFALLLTDVVMPGGNGRELADWTTTQWPHLPVLFMSGYTDDALLLRAVLETGAPLVQKPFTPSEFARRVRQAIDGAAAEAVAR